MKFEYSPGLIGYGAKGADGSAGLPGLALYFTDRNPLTDFITIENAIANDEVLWSTATPGTKLPGGRKYLEMDLIIDPRGFVYKIDNPVTGEYSNTGMTLNKSEFFQASAPAVQTDNGFARYFNKNGAEKFIIDNVFSDTELNYSASPSKIYGISPKNFTRIEYLNINDSSYNGFSIYSSGETTIVDDHESLAIVKDSNGFRIGNIDSSGFLRDVDLFLDVSSLKYTRQPGNVFNKNTISGTILTNYEVSANILFDPNFTTSPVSFVANATSTSVKIDWVLSDFANDYDRATLYFYQKQTPSGSYEINAQIVQPLIFHLSPSDDIGSIIITNLTLGILYEFYISIEKDGWERSSIIKQITTTNIPIFLNILAPSPASLTADYNGVFTQNLNNIYTVTLDTNSFTGWRMTDVPKPSWVGTSKLSNPVSGLDTFDVSLSKNTGTVARSGNITISSEAANKVISITQNCFQTWVFFDDSGQINFSPPLTDQYATVNIKIYAWVRVRRGYTLGSRTGSCTILLKQSATTRATATKTETASNNTKDGSTSSSYTAYITPSNSTQWYLDNTVLDCQVDRYQEEPGAGQDDYEYSMVWGEITSAYITSGTGRIDVSTGKKVWYADRHATYPSKTCITTSEAASGPPTMYPFP